MVPWLVAVECHCCSQQTIRKDVLLAQMHFRHQDGYSDEHVSAVLMGLNLGRVRRGHNTDRTTQYLLLYAGHSLRRPTIYSLLGFPELGVPPLLRFGCRSDRDGL